MPATVTFSRPSFTGTDNLPAATFNGVTAVSGTVPDATSGVYGVIRLAGDLSGNADAPVLAATGATAGTYGATVLDIPHLNIDAKGRVTAITNRSLGTPYGKTLIEAVNEAAARTVLGLGGSVFLDAIYLSVMGKVYPVGELLITRRSGNPSTWLGFGTWVPYGEGRTLVGFNAAETEFDALDKTGGAKTHTLAGTEIPAHTHAFSGSGSTDSAGAHTHSLPGQIINGTAPLSAGVAGAGTVNLSSTSTTGSSGAHTHGVTVAGTTGSTGTGGAHNNLQPFITVYFWRRTA